MDQPPGDLPRRNGELVFDAPWESRAFGTAAAYLQSRGLSWETFRVRLIDAVAATPDETPYYDAFATALESLVVADGALTTKEIDREVEQGRTLGAYTVG